MVADVECVTEVYRTSTKAYGTGYLIAPDLVLTARHVVVDSITDPPPEDIWIRTIAHFNCNIPFKHAKLIWPLAEKLATCPEIDIALLEIKPDDATRAAARRVQLGTEAVNDSEKFQVYFIGFPHHKGDEITGIRDTAQEYGEVAPASAIKQKLYEISVKNAGPNPDYEDWHGASGAAVFVGGQIIGVLTVQRIDDRTSFMATRLDAALSCDEFRERSTRYWADRTKPIAEPNGFQDPRPGGRLIIAPLQQYNVQNGALLRFLGGLPIVPPESRRKPWHENIIMRAVVDRTALAAVTVGARADDLLTSCMSAESLLESVAPRRFGQRRWFTWSPGQGPLTGGARGIIWSIEADDEVSIGQLEDLLRTIQSERGAAVEVGSVLIIALSGDLEDKARVYLDSLAEIADKLGCGAALQGWSTTAYYAFARSLAENECAQLDRGGERELIRLLRASRSMDHRTSSLQEINARSEFLTAGLRRLCNWASGTEPDESLEEFLSETSVDDFRVADLAGLFIEAPQNPTPGDDKRAHAIIRAARLNPDLRMALIGLPVSAEVIEALAASDSNVRVAVGLLTRSELASVPAPWSGHPFRVWRRGRDLVRQSALRQKGKRL